MIDITEKLRKFAETRKQLGSQPCGYDFMLEAADYIDQHCDTIANLQFHNRGLQQRINELQAQLKAPNPATNLNAVKREAATYAYYYALHDIRSANSKINKIKAESYAAQRYPDKE